MKVFATKGRKVLRSCNPGDAAGTREIFYLFIASGLHVFKFLGRTHFGGLAQDWNSLLCREVIRENLLRKAHARANIDVGKQIVLPDANRPGVKIREVERLELLRISLSSRSFACLQDTQRRCKHALAKEW